MAQVQTGSRTSLLGEEYSRVPARSGPRPPVPRRLRHIAVTGALLGLAVAGGAQSPEVAGVVTELKVGRGRVEITRSGSTDWRSAAPLLALRPGDAVRATDDAWAVVVLVGGGRAVRIDAASSPFVVLGQQAPSASQKARALVDETLASLSKGGRDPGMVSVSTRGIPSPFTIVTPRNSPVLPGPLLVEWVGDTTVECTARIETPAGLLWERAAIRQAHVEYPAEAPALRPDVRHTILVSGTSGQPGRAWFQVAGAEETERVRGGLAALEDELARSLSHTSLALVQAGFLAGQGFLHDARARLLSALARDPKEPSLHQLLGHVYQRSGLSELATQAYREADALARSPAR